MNLNFIKNNKRLDLTQWFIRKIKDETFVDEMLHIKYSNRFFSRNLYETTNPKEGTIYYIDTSAPKRGFFAMIYHTLCALIYADIKGYVPYIYYKKSPYNENNEVFGTNNSFEYYFTQPCIKDIKELDTNQMFYYNQVHRYLIEELIGNGQDSYYYTKKLFEKLALVIDKYINFNERTQNYLIKCIKEKNIGKKVLGVHYRGTDYKCGYYGHPVYITLDDYISVAEKKMCEGYFDYIFLATDDKEAEDRFRDVFGSTLIIYEDSLRSDGKEASFMSRNVRNNNNYLLGLEVLRDMYSLSKCNGMICGLSQVSNIARIYKMSDNDEYDYLKVFDNGLVTDRKYYNTY